MELKDVIEGQIYYVEYSKTKWCILKASNGNFNNVPGYYYENGKYEFLKSNHWTCYSNIRLANPQEIAHLNACIAASKYVDLPVELNSNELLKSLVIW